MKEKKRFLLLLILLLLLTPQIASAWTSWIEDKVVSNLTVYGNIYDKTKTSALSLGTTGACLKGSISTTGAAHVGGYVTVGTLADANAPTSSLYYSSDAGKLVYKDSGGIVRELW